jgi:DNA end-binding protein Ku
MARAIWSGSLAFGLVNVPVGLYSATEDKTVHFHQFERGTSSRIRNRRVNEDTNKEVAFEDIVKGYDTGKGRYVMVTPEELESVEPGRSRTIEITDFVDAAEVDPIYYQKTYYLAPKDETAERAYSLLTRALEKADRVGIATFVMRDKQYLAAIRPKGDVLTLETMFFADEVRDPEKEIDTLPATAPVRRRDLDTAMSLIDALTTRWKPANYRDTYRDRVMQLIDAKRKGREIVTAEEPEPGAEVVDLMEALQGSLDAVRGRKPGNAHQAGRLKTRRRGEAGGDGDELAAMSKSDLADLATKLDVPGRSSMTKEQLVDALTDVGRATKKAS